MKKKWHFFVQKHGLTPLEKCNLWDRDFFFLQSKEVFFLSRTFLNLISSLISNKNK